MLKSAMMKNFCFDGKGYLCTYTIRESNIINVVDVIFNSRHNSDNDSRPRK